MPAVLSKTLALRRLRLASGRAVCTVSGLKTFRHYHEADADDRTAECYIWNWHENYFDEDNCNFEYLHLKDAFEALKLNAYCEDAGGHNVGWALGHYDEGRVDENDPSGFGQMLPPIKQTYVVDGKAYMVRSLQA